MLKRLGLERAPKDYLSSGMAISILLHILLAFVFRPYPMKLPTPQEVIEVTLAPPPQPLRRTIKPQIVTEPQSSVAQKTPLNAKYQAEKNRVAKKEQIKRGVHPEAAKSLGKQGGQSSASQQNTAQQPRRAPQKPQKAITQFKLDQKTALKRFALNNKPKQATAQSFQAPAQASRPFSRPRGSGARFLGQAGTADHLPDLPDGDITLLNTKANKFAVFVRRVATQVFGKIQEVGWAQLRAGDIRAIAEMTTVRAILSPKGDLIDLQLLTPSGSSSFDQTIITAVKMGASDPHPPPDAARSDGNISFIFKSRSWSRTGASRGGGLSERRWLLLATGLE